MKRQSEELFFKYNTIPTKYNKSAINVKLPSDYSPIAGDVIEIFISEDQNFGFISYYANLLVYKPVNSGILYDFTAISGKLPILGDTFVQIDMASLSIIDGVKFVTLSVPSEKEVFLDPSSNYLVCLIVHRSKTSIELYEV